MPNYILRIIRPVERTAEYEYIKEFFRFIGCLVTDLAVDDTILANWIEALKPENESNSVDIVLNCQEDPYLDHCKRYGIRRIYCDFDFNNLCGAVADEPGAVLPQLFPDKQLLRRSFLVSLIAKLWANDLNMQGQIQRIANIYLENSNGELFYFLQAKRNLRVLTMGEVLKDRSAQVTKIAMLPYIKNMIAALWETYCRLELVPGIHGMYAKNNAANKICEIAELLYDSERIRINDITYMGRQCMPPQMEQLLKNTQQLVEMVPEFVSAYLLMANICKSHMWKTETEEWCYQKIRQSIAADSRDHAFIWYRHGYFYEKRKKDLGRALECYQRAVQLNPECYQARFKLGYYAAAKDRFQEAETSLRKMIQSAFHGRSTDPDEDGAYSSWLSLSAKESQYVYKAYILLAKIALIKTRENALREYVGRACMAATRFTEATVIRQVSDMGAADYTKYMEYHRFCTPVWAMWKVLSPWSENVIHDQFVRDIVRSYLARWS